MVMDSLYRTNRNLLNAVSEEIVAIPEIKNTQKLVVKEVLEDTEKEALAVAEKFLNEPDFLAPEYRYSKQNTCFITTANNLRDFGGVPSDSVIAVRKHRFDLAFLIDDDFYHYENNAIWEYHQDSKKMTSYHDSIYVEEKQQMIDQANRFVARVKETKYLVYITDLYYLKPQMTTTDQFESGMLITAVTVFDRKNKKKLGHTVLYTTNSDKVSAIPVPIDDDEMKKKVYYKNVESDLAQNRDKAVEDFLNRKKVTSF